MHAHYCIIKTWHLNNAHLNQWSLSTSRCKSTNIIFHNSNKSSQNVTAIAASRTNKHLITQAVPFLHRQF